MQKNTNVLNTEEMNNLKGGGSTLYHLGKKVPDLLTKSNLLVMADANLCTHPFNWVTKIKTK